MQSSSTDANRTRSKSLLSCALELGARTSLLLLGTCEALAHLVQRCSSGLLPYLFEKPDNLMIKLASSVGLGSHKTRDDGQQAGYALEDFIFRSVVSCRHIQREQT